MPFDEVLRALEALHRARGPAGRHLTAAVTQEIRVPQLARPVRSEGRLWFVAPDRFRLEITRPRHSCVVLDRGTFASFRGESDQPEATGSGGEVSAELTRLLRIAEDPAHLREVAATRDVTGQVAGDELLVTIRPRPGDAALFQRYAAFRLRIGRTDGRPVALEMVGKDRDTTEYRLADVSWPASIPDALFHTDRLTR